MNAALTYQLFDTRDVDCTPGTVNSARSESDFVTSIVNRFTQTVNPAEAKSFIHRLWPANGRLTGMLPVKSNPLLGLIGVMNRQPAAELRWCPKKYRLRPAGTGFTSLWHRFRRVRAVVRRL